MAENEQEPQQPYVDGDGPPEQPPNEFPATPPSAAQGQRGVPGNEGFYTSGAGGGGAGYNNAEEIMSFPSDDPGRYLPRAIVDEVWLKRQVRMRARVMRMYTGFEDPLQAMWFYLAGTPAIGGQARKDFVMISIGNRQVEIAGQSGGLLGGIRERLMGNQNNNLNQP